MEHKVEKWKMTHEHHYGINFEVYEIFAVDNTIFFVLEKTRNRIIFYSGISEIVDSTRFYREKDITIHHWREWGWNVERKEKS